jgi:hypothetical protein
MCSLSKGSTCELIFRGSPTTGFGYFTQLVGSCPLSIANENRGADQVKDLNGYRLVFGHHIYSVGPPIRIERVDVPVRLEKRLAGLLQDLAAKKRMTVGSCLEEILLHTNDGVGPHTASQLKYIAELKKKHGIDYDSHGSYRFVEE